MTTVATRSAINSPCAHSSRHPPCATAEAPKRLSTHLDGRHVRPQPSQLAHRNTRGVHRSVGLSLALSMTLGVTSSVFAPSSVSAQTIYKWTDSNNVTHYSTTPPPESSQGEHHVIDRQGQTRDVRRAPPPIDDPAALEAAEAAAQAELAAREAQRRDDDRARFLRQAFASVDDIARTYDRRIAVLGGNRSISEAQEHALLRERARISAQRDSQNRRPDELARYERELAELNQRIAEERAARASQFEQQQQLERERDTAIADWERLIENAPSR